MAVIYCCNFGECVNCVFQKLVIYVLSFLQVKTFLHCLNETEKVVVNVIANMFLLQRYNYFRVQAK